MRGQQLRIKFRLYTEHLGGIDGDYINTELNWRYAAYTKLLM